MQALGQGIAEASDAMLYLNNVTYGEITRFGVSPSRALEAGYRTHAGGATPSDPTTQTFWRVSKHGSGPQIPEWSPESGSYWIALVNKDGSAGVDLTMKLGAKIPLLSIVGSVLLVAGIVALVIGGAMVYFGVHR